MNLCLNKLFFKTKKHLRIKAYSIRQCHKFKNILAGQRWHMSLIPELVRQRQPYLCEFQAILKILFDMLIIPIIAQNREILHIYAT